MRLFFVLALVVAVLGLVSCGGGDTGGANQAGKAVSKAAEKAQTEAGEAAEAVKEKVETAAEEAKEKAGEMKEEAEEAGEAQEEANPILARSLKKDPGPDDEVAVMKTNMGTIVLRLFAKQAPITVANFKGLAAKGYYNGVTFHRVIDGFMIQGGDPTGTGRGGSSLWGGTIPDEFRPELTFARPGMLAMANTGRPNTGKSQFFITLVPTTYLNNKHTIFGEVQEGMDVVKAIGKVKTGPGDKPVKPVIIESITIEKR